jgi:hypothetical protein
VDLVSELILAVAAAALTAAAAIGAGSFAVGAARAWVPFHRWLLRLVLGLGLLPLLLVLLFEVCRLPARPIVAAVVGAMGLVLAVVQERRWRPRAEATAVDLLLPVLAAGLFLAALSGLLGQLGFEGLDPWRHAFGATWVADTGLLRQPDPGFPLIHYVDAYPPLFDVLLALPVGLLGVTGPAVKGVAALLVGIAPLAVWLLARALWDDERRAVAAALIYALLPSAVPRHLWGHSLAVIMVIVGLAAAVELRRDRRWWMVVAVAFGCALLAAPSQGLKGLTLLLATIVLATASDRRWLVRLLAGTAAAGVVAGLWLLPAGLRYGFHPLQLTRQMQPPELRRSDDPLTALAPDEQAPLPWVAKEHDRIGIREAVLLRPHRFLTRLSDDMRFSLIIPTGLGLPLLALCALGLVPHRRGSPCLARRAAAIWLALAALLTFGAPLGVVFFAWRSWLLLAVCAALLAADGVMRLTTVGPSWRAVVLILAGIHVVLAVAFDIGSGLMLSQLARPAWLAVVVAALLLAFRLGSRRYVVACLLCAHLVVVAPVRGATLLDPMPPRVFFDRIEHQSYIELAATLPRGARVWPLSGGLRFDIVNGLDLSCTPYLATELAMARQCTRGELPQVKELIAWLHAAGYQWLVLDPSFGELHSKLGDPRAFDNLRQALTAHPDLHPVATGSAGVGATQLIVWKIGS